MNMPNFASRYQAVRWSGVGWDDTATADGFPALSSGSAFRPPLDARSGAAEVKASSFRRVTFVNTPFETDCISINGELTARLPTPTTPGLSQFPILRSQERFSIPR